MACQTFSGLPTLGCCNVPPQSTSVNRYIAAIAARMWCARSGPCIPYRLAKISQRTIGVDPVAFATYNFDEESRFDPRGPTQTITYGGLPVGVGPSPLVNDLQVSGAFIAILSDTPTSLVLTATHFFQAGGTMDFSYSFTLSEPYLEAEIQADLLALYNDFTAADFAAPFAGFQDFRRSWSNGQIVPFGNVSQDTGGIPLCVPRQPVNQATMYAWGARKLDTIHPVSTAGIPGMSFPTLNLSRSIAKAIVQLAGVPPTQRQYCKLTFGSVDSDCPGTINCTNTCEQGTLANPITIEGTGLPAGTGVILEAGITGCVCNPAP